MDYYRKQHRHYSEDRYDKRNNYNDHSHRSKGQQSEYQSEYHRTSYRQGANYYSNDYSSSSKRKSDYDTDYSSPHKRQRTESSQHFVTVDLDSKYFKSVEDKFNSIVAPIYGDQKCALEKIGSGEDRKCELLILDGVPVGMLVYKINPTSEYEKLKNSLEIKTLVSFDPDKPTILGALLDKAKGIAGAMKSDFIHVTVSNTAWKTLDFLRKNKFRVSEKWENKYGTNVPEFLMNLDLHAPVIKDSITLGAQYIRMIKNNQKTVEGRLNSPMFKGIHENDFIKFYQNRNPSLYVTVKITKVNKYESFKEMLEVEGYKNCIPDAHSLNHAVKIYKDIPRYSEKEKRLGVLAFRVIPVDV